MTGAIFRLVTPCWILGLMMCSCAAKDSMRGDDPPGTQSGGPSEVSGSERKGTGMAAELLPFQLLGITRNGSEGPVQMSLKERLEGGDEISFYLKLPEQSYITIFGLPDVVQGRPDGDFHVLFPVAGSVAQTFGPSELARVPAETFWIRVPDGTRGLGFAVTRQAMSLNTASSPARAQQSLMQLATSAPRGSESKVLMIMPGF